MRKGISALVVLVCLVARPAWAEKKTPFTVTVAVNAAQAPVSPEGFVEGNNVWLQDSVKDLKKALDGKEFTPNKTTGGSRAKYLVVNDPAHADVVLTVAARGTSLEALGQRTTMEFYRGVVMADTVPTVGVTRWVSMVLSVDTYKKEFVTYSTNQSRFSAGAWSADANLLARLAAGWVMLNEPKIRERQDRRVK